MYIMSKYRHKRCKRTCTKIKRGREKQRDEPAPGGQFPIHRAGTCKNTQINNLRSKVPPSEKLYIKRIVVEHTGARTHPPACDSHAKLKGLSDTLVKCDSSLKCNFSSSV